MKYVYTRFRIMLRAFGLGLAAVCVWQGLSLAWWGVPVDLPEARFANVLDVTVPLAKKLGGSKYLCDEFTDENYRASCLHQAIFQGRDMSLYDNGGRAFKGCDDYPSYCEKPLEKARRFVWQHWKQRKRGYVIVARVSPEAVWETHLFIEPGPDGRWRVAERRMPMLREPIDPEHYWLGDLIEIKWNRATAEDERDGMKPGIMYLRLSNSVGDSLIL